MGGVSPNERPISFRLPTERNKNRMSTLCDVFHRVCHNVANQLGPGHSEAVYQKACGQLLQVQQVRHHTEQHVPVTLSVQSSPPGTVFHIGDERIDILMYDDSQHVHVAELKAIGAKVSPTKPTPQSLLSASHVQLLKYIRLLNTDATFRGRIHTGYVVNFRQHVTMGAPDSMVVEFDTYDAHHQQWSFNYTPHSILPLQPASQPPPVIHLQ